MLNQPRKNWDTEEQTPELSPRLTALILGLGIGVALMGLAVMVGWHTRTVWLVQWHPTLVAIVHNTALGFLLTGTALVLAKLGHRRWAAWLGCLVAIFSLAIFMQYVLGVDFGIDNLFAQHFIATKTLHPGRMAANTAVCFVFAGMALVAGALNLAHRSLWSGMGGTLVSGFGLTAIIGYLLDPASSYGWGMWTRMAIQTAIAFLCLGMGITAMAWEDNKKQEEDLLRWWPIQIFILFSVIFFDMWMPIHAAQTNHDLQHAIFQSIVNWFPIFGATIVLLISYLVLIKARSLELERALEIERKRMEMVLEAIPVWVYLQAPDYSIRWYNRQFQELFGQPGRLPCYQAIQKRLQPCEHCPTFRVFETKTLQQWEYTDPHSGRTSLIYDNYFLDSDGSPLVLEMGFDITDMKQAQPNFADCSAKSL